ncbi:MAG TPA: SIR2 family protein [Bryobacteraceae bacterium]|nr:SIR2 family protein [Bryobacteraceae bacterium]
MQLEEKDWETLLTRLKAGKCTPFLGAAVNHGILPLGGEVANRWASDFDYPLESRSDLSKVAQFLAIKTDASRPKEMILDLLDREEKPFNFNDPDEPLNVLAKLPLPVYITTNYDDLLFRAIEHHGNAVGRRAAIEICRWNSRIAFQPSLFKRGSKFSPTGHTPVIYHLHGHRSLLDSIVLTEDDYLDFLVTMSQEETFLPPRIQESITGSSVMFVGYSLADIDFRVLFRGLLGNLEAALGKMSVAVQLPFDDANPNKQKAEKYITEYFGKTRGTELRVYWGTARSFAKELWRRWREFNA